MPIPSLLASSLVFHTKIKIYLNALVGILTMWLSLHVSFAYNFLIIWQCLSKFEILRKSMKIHLEDS